MPEKAKSIKQNLSSAVFAFKNEIIMKCPGGKIFCSSSCSTNSVVQKQKPNRLTTPHNIISVPCNLFSMIIRYLERDIIRKKQLSAFCCCCCCLLRISWQPGNELWKWRGCGAQICSSQLCWDTARQSVWWNRITPTSNPSGANWLLYLPSLKQARVLFTSAS